MTDPDLWAARWFRRYEPDMPPEAWRRSLRYAFIRAEAGSRPAKRDFLAAARSFVETIRWITQR